MFFYNQKRNAKDYIPILREKRPHSWGWALLYFVPILLAVLIALTMRIDPLRTENIYSYTIFPVINKIVSFLPSFIPFSLAGLIMTLFYTCLAISVIAIPVIIIRSDEKKACIVGIGKFIFLFISFVLLLFTVTCAPNYHRRTFSELSELEIRDSTVVELVALCEILIEDANTQREELEEALPFAESAVASKTAFNSIEEFPFLPDSIVVPKAMLFSEALSYMNFTGFYFPFTGEATINAHAPLIDIPFTMCHELAHTVGFMREDEANFIAYLACKQSEENYIKYSGSISALIRSMNALYRVAPEQANELQSLYSQKVTTDMTNQSEYWSNYDTKVAEVSTAVNDAYLKVNDQADGTHSYGRMVDLLLAYYREKGDI